MEIIKKIGKLLLGITMFFAGLFTIFVISGVFVIFFSRIFTYLWDVNESDKILSVLFLTATILGLIYKPVKWLTKKWTSFMNTI